MHLGKPLLRRTIIPRPESLPEPAPADGREPTMAGDDGPVPASAGDPSAVPASAGDPDTVAAAAGEPIRRSSREPRPAS